jgi:hypothetical protein
MAAPSMESVHAVAPSQTADGEAAEEELPDVDTPTGDTEIMSYEIAAVEAELAAAAEGLATRPIEIEPDHELTAKQRAGILLYKHAGGHGGPTDSRARAAARAAMHEALGQSKASEMWPSVDTPSEFAAGSSARGAALRAPRLWVPEEVPLYQLAEGEAAAVDAHAFRAEHVERLQCENCRNNRPCYINAVARELGRGHDLVFRANAARGPGPPLLQHLELERAVAGPRGGGERDSAAREALDGARDSLIDELAAARVVGAATTAITGVANNMFAVAPRDYKLSADEAVRLEAARAGPDGAAALVRTAGVIAREASEAIIAEMERAGVGDDDRRAAWEQGLNLRLVPRKARLICNAKPLNKSVAPWHYRMHTIYNLLDGVQQNGWLAKADIKRGFYHLRLSPDAWRFLSFYHRGRLYHFKRLPMGLTSSPGWFSQITAEINAWLRASGVEAHIVYLDDFVVYGSTKSSCAEALALLKLVCGKVGIELAGDDKTSIEPVQQLVALGVEIDLVAFTVSIPADRLIKLGIYARLALREAEAGRKVPTDILTSIAGRAGWVSHLNPMLRLWTCGMDALAHAGIGRKGLRHVPAGIVDALRYIVEALDNGTLRGESLCSNSPELARRTVTITSDASKTATATTIAIRLGAGIQVRIELPGCLQEDIDVLEMLAIVIAVRRWGPRLRGAQIICGCDNTAVVDMVDAGRSKRPDIRKLLRWLYRAMERYDLRVVAVWLPRWYNYRNDRVAGLPRGEVLAFAPDAILESEEGTPAQVVKKARRLT